MHEETQNEEEKKVEIPRPKKALVQIKRVQRGHIDNEIRRMKTDTKTKHTHKKKSLKCKKRNLKCFQVSEGENVFAYSVYNIEFKMRNE